MDGNIRFEGAEIRNQGEKFAVVAVKPAVLGNKTRAGLTKRAFGRCFPNTPVVLTAKDGQGHPQYYGRRDLVEFLAASPAGAVHLSTYGVNVPWSAYRIGEGGL